jgi:MFS family permease
MTTHLKSSTLFAVYLLGLFLAFHSALPAYINSSYLSGFVGEKMVGLIYAVGSLLTIFAFFVAPSVLKKFGAYHTALFLVTVEIFSLLGLATLNQSPWLILLFMLNLITAPLVYFISDIFLEGASADKKTGMVRGIYLTTINLAWAASPRVSGWIVDGVNYTRVYFFSALFLILVLLILLFRLRHHHDSEYQTTRVWQTIKIIWRRRDIRRILLANFLLYFFYSWMMIYTPLYLHNNLGFSWAQIGTIFGIMLLPFVFVQLPLGRLADTRFGEKEILSIGFIIMAIATASIAFVDSTLWWVFAGILFVTRIGAATVEIMCDTYFFKKVDSQDTGVISFFRLCGPLAYVLGPLAATIVLNLFNLDAKYLFLILGIGMLGGLDFSLKIRDTKPTLQ